MKTLITKDSLNKENIQKGLNNPFGMYFDNSKETRKAIAKEVDLVLREIRAKHKK